MKLLALALILAVATALGIAALETQVLYPHPATAPTKGIVWHGHTFPTRGDFARWLRSQGVRYGVWARHHPLVIGFAANPKAHPHMQHAAEARQARQPDSDWKLKSLGGGAAVLASLSLGIVFVRRRPSGAGGLATTNQLAARRAVLAARGGARWTLRRTAKATTLLSSRLGASWANAIRRHPSLVGVAANPRAGPPAQQAEGARLARQKGSNRKLGSLGGGAGAAVLASLSRGSIFGRSRLGGTHELATTIQLAARQVVLAAKRGPRWMLRRAAKAASLLSSGLAASWANTIRRRRVELAWYLATGLLAAGLGLAVTAWLNGV
jgi:hypothetical protein